MFSNSFKEYSYWLDTDRMDFTYNSHFPNKTDVVIIGSGYTGLNAAIQTARSGRETFIIEKLNIGSGCSSKNGGQVSNAIKPSLESLSKKFGLTLAKSLKKEGRESLQWLSDFISEEKIKCDFNQSGLFHAAHTPEMHENLSKECNYLYDQENIETFMISRKDQNKEIGSDAYYGGIIYPKDASLNPVKFHNGLLIKAIQAGVKFIPNCEMLRINNISNSFEIHTTKGVVKSKNVIIATNGYTTKSSPWLNKRNIPIGSYVISTDELPLNLIEELFPSNKHITDARRMVYYYRPSPDKKRVIFGGRVSSKDTNVKNSGPLLYDEMCRIFPQLSGVKISHSWMGLVSYSFDKMPHIGVRDGVHYAMGYCGSGVALSSYLGMKTGKKIINSLDGSSAFDKIPYPTRFFYNGNPWFLPPLVAFYRYKDKKEVNKNN